MHLEELISRTSTDRRKRTAPSAVPPIPDQLKHERLIRYLTAVLSRRERVIKPTEDDIRIARERVDTAQRRADLEYQRKHGISLNRHAMLNIV
jgi:hypothetical protein